MRVVCAPDKLRGSLDAAQAAAALAAGVRAAGGTPVEHPLADGGEGSRHTVQTACGGAVVDVDSVDALGRPATTAVPSSRRPRRSGGTHRPPRSTM
nr:glycerate kinase [Streptomyces milbemycinicus]